MKGIKRKLTDRISAAIALSYYRTLEETLIKSQEIRVELAAVITDETLSEKQRIVAFERAGAEMAEFIRSRAKSHDYFIALAPFAMVLLNESVNAMSDARQAAWKRGIESAQSNASIAA